VRTPYHGTMPPSLLFAAAALFAATPAQTDSLRNPFQGFETHVLDNGVRVWFKSLDGVSNVSVSVTLPFGADQDPPGKEESAHFLEHMLFSDHGGRTEEEIKEEIEGRGGQRNGLTYPDRTFYYVTIGREHGLFALRWLGRLMEPHEMAPEVVDRNRRPVAVEIQAEPWNLLDRAGVLLNPSWLRPSGYWEREFGVATRADRVYDRHATLYALDRDDLRSFYDRYYAPGAMTVTVVGDLPQDSVLAVAREAFGGLRQRPVPEAYEDPVDPGRFRRAVTFQFSPNPRYRTRFKVFEPTSDERLDLLFIRDFLSRRLDRRLRYGEDKAVYGMAVSVVYRGPVAYFAVEGTVAEDAYARARDVIEDELEALRNGGHAPEEFEEDRTAVVERLRSSSQTAESLALWVRNHLYHQDVWQDFPDVLAAYESVTQERLASLSRSRFVREDRLDYLDRKQPIPVEVGLLLLLVGVWATLRATRWILTSPVDMRNIRYVARIKLSLPVMLVSGLLFAAGGLAMIRLWAFAAERAAYHWIEPVDSYAVQVAAYGAMGALTLILAVAWLSLFPRKILVFPDHIRVKYLSYRSRAVHPADVEGLTLSRFADVWLSPTVLGVTPLATGLFAPGVLLRLRGRRGLFFRVRNAEELLDVMGEALRTDEPEEGLN